MTKELTVVVRGYTRSERHVALLARDESDTIVAGVVLDVGNGDVARHIGWLFVEGLREMGYSVMLSSGARAVISDDNSKEV